MARSRTEMDPKLRRLLQRLDADVQEPVKREIAKSATLLYDEIYARAPVDTGALRESIGLRTGSKGFAAEVGFHPKFKRKWDKAGWRAHFQERGTKGYQSGETRAGGRGKASKPIPAQPARPFVRPAYEAHKEEMIARQAAAVAGALKKAGGG